MSEPAIGAAPGGGAEPPATASLGTIIIRRGVMPRAPLPAVTDYCIHLFKVMRTGESRVHNRQQVLTRVLACHQGVAL